MTTLYLVRHGETKDNVAKIMQGQRQGDLTPAGARQIEELSSSLSGIHLDAIISSDLQRAYDSANGIGVTSLVATYQISRASLCQIMWRRWRRCCNGLNLSWTGQK